ncbi:MAG: AlpA family phage regulatory protein [Glaciecola sp.]
MQYIRAKEIAKLLGVNESTIWRWRKKKKFPEPFNLGPNTVVWSKSSIEKWVNSRSKDAKS